MRFETLLDDVKEYILIYHDNDSDRLNSTRKRILAAAISYKLYDIRTAYTLDDAFIAHNLSGGVSREEIKKYVDAYFKSKSNDIIKYLEQDITECVNILNEIYDLLKDFKPTKNDEVLSLISELVRKNTIGLQNLLAALK